MIHYFSNKYKTVANYFSSVLLFVLTYTGFVKNNTPVTQGSLTFTEQDNVIEVIETSETVDLDNLLKYLRHHFMFTDESFNSVIFATPLNVRFKCDKKTHRIVLKKLNCTKKDHVDIVKLPTILSVVISKVTDTESKDNDGVCITNTIVEYHGHTKNFYTHIPDAVYNFNEAIKDFSHLGNIVTIYDTTGDIKMIYL